MKLKTFEKASVAVVTEYVVFRGEDVVESFTVDYHKKDKDGKLAIGSINSAILKRIEYENSGAKVRFVDVNSATGHLKITIEI